MFARKRIRSTIVTTITVALLASGAHAQGQHLTAREVVVRIQQQVGVPWQSDTVDTFTAGVPLLQETISSSLTSRLSSITSIFPASCPKKTTIRCWWPS